MKELLSKLEPRDCVALLVLVGVFTLKMAGHHNGGLDTAAAVIIGYYFSKRVFEIKNEKGEK